jgi:prevent-host-death family protein
MTPLTVSEARTRLYRLLDQAAASHEPVQIKGRRSSAVLVSTDDWRSIEEALHLLAVPGMRDSITQGLRTPTRRMLRRLSW